MDLISICDLEKKEIEKILQSAKKISEGERVNLGGKILATLFFEPSTRTKLSFQSASLRCGMQYLDFNPELSSVKKGESYTDTIKIISGYADILAIRHPKEGAARLASELIENPVINAGDGSNQHPSQTLIDLFTILKNKGQIKGLEISLYGDLKHSRTMRSLVYGLGMFGAIITLISPKGLELDQNYVGEIKGKFGSDIKVTNEPDFSEADVLYVNRIQQERFIDPYEAKRVSEKFMIKKDDLVDAKEDLIILNPLPKIGELEPSIDDTPMAKYFEQAKFGVPIRSAILKYCLGGI